MVARLHELGILSSLFPQSLKLDSKILAEEKDAKLDIYNYAARFDCVPKFGVRLVERPFRGAGKKVVEVTVDLAEQNIHVVARGLDSKSAEISATLRFRQQAEIYHAQGDKGSIVIRDSEALTTANSKKFFDFYKIVYPRAKIEVHFQDFWTISHQNGQKSQVTIDGALVGEPVEMRSKKLAEDLAYLTAAIALKKKQPDLYPRFLQALKVGNGSILKPIMPIPMPITHDAVLLMRETLHGARELGSLVTLPSETDQSIIEEATSGTKGPPRYLLPLSSAAAKQRDSQMQHAHRAYLQDVSNHELRRKKAELPMNQNSAKVLDLINNHPYSIIVGATGSGKTTQVPQILLEDATVKGSGSACNIICTQPRRIAATSVARRVAQERAERLQGTVGYHVRFDAKLPSNRGSISFCTTGILLRQLQSTPDGIMDGVSHLIIDEVHERAMEVDFLLVSLKRIIKERTTKGLPSPKIVLMSATIDTDLFAAYFPSDRGTADCPSLTVSGRNFPVQEKYLDSIVNELKQSYPASSLWLLGKDEPTRKYLTINDEFLQKQSAFGRATVDSAPQNEESVIDWKKERKVSADGETVTGSEKDNALVPNALVATTIAHIAKTSDQGAILAFLPGIDEIVKVEKWLTDTHVLGVDFRDASKFKIYMLHSSIAAGQTEVFETVPLGCRKIILATNIAETSITIPDVQYVVDTGKAREKQYDQVRRITNLTCTWISKSNSKQRAGRAGRVQNGNYYALFTKECYDSMRASPLAEMLRSDLQETCLAIKAQAFTAPIREFLSEAIEPPPPKAVDASVVNLEALDALTSDEKLTPLGRLLATLPVHPSLGKMIVLGVVFRCLDPMLIIGASASERSVFVHSPDARQKAQVTKNAFAGSSRSDHIAVLNAVCEMRHRRHHSGEHAMFDFGMQNFIHIGAFKSIMSTAQQIADILIDAGLIPSTAPYASRDPQSQFGHPFLNHNSGNISLVKALSLAGLHPNLAVATVPRFFRTPGESKAMIHLSSVNTFRTKNNDTSHDTSHDMSGTLYSYSSMAKSIDGSISMLRDTTQCTPLMAALFGGKIVNRESNILEMDGWLPWWVRAVDRSAGYPSSAKLIVEFRKQLELVLSRAFQDLSKVEAPENNGQSVLAASKILSLFADGVVKLLDRDIQSDSTENRPWGMNDPDDHDVPDRYNQQHGYNMKRNGPPGTRRGYDRRPLKAKRHSRGDTMLEDYEF